MKTITTKKLSAFIITMVFSLSFVYAQSPRDVQTINPIIGDISYVAKFGHQPDASVSEDLRIQTHLAYAENLLRQKDASNLSPEMQQKRAHMLDLLRDYWTAGKFPRNYDYKDQRRPCFIDKDQTICAVGYLVEQTAGRKAAEAINNKFKYEVLMAMNDELVDGWIATSGLTKEECATIQPSYGGPCGWNPCCNNGNPQPNHVYACRMSNCVQECKCVNANAVANWQAHGKPCEGRLSNSKGSEEFALNIYPNPASTSATIYFSLPQSEKVTIGILDLTGRMVTVVSDVMFEAGENEVKWNTENITAGIYFLRMEAGDTVQMEKITVMK